MAQRFHRTLLATTLLFSIGTTLPGQTRIIVDPAITYQRFEGWGTSLCWWAHQEGGGSQAYVNRIAEVLVDPDSGLGYSIFRYNIGGGDRPGHTDIAPGRAVPGYKSTETGPYDWTADLNQRTIVAALAAKGKKINQGIIWEAFSNSPPWWMTVAGCADGDSTCADNLKSDYFDDFAGYLTEVIKHFRDSLGIGFRTIDPFNEPSAGWWCGNNNQEGCNFKNRQPAMVKLLGKSLTAAGLFPGTSVSVADENSISSAVTGINAYDDSSLSFISQINTHGYSGRSASNFTAFAALASSKKKMLWMSESGPLSGTNGQDIAMFMSRYIIEDLKYMKVSAWIDWQSYAGGGNWETIRVDKNTLSIIPARRCYMQAAFSRFIRPGSLIVESSDSNSLAALVPGTGNGVFIIRNGGASSINYTWDLTRFTTVGSSAAIYQYLVSNYRTLSKLPDAGITNKQFTIISPPQSITTCVVPGIAQTALKHLDRPQVHSLAMTSGKGYAISRYLSLTGEYSLTIFNCTGRKVCHRGGNGTNAGVTVDLCALGLSGGVYAVQLRQRGALVSGIFYLAR
jgi:O-glycosyl hydrolase